MGEDVRITVVATGFGQEVEDMPLASFVGQDDIDTDFGTRKPKYTPPAIFGKKKFRSVIESPVSEEPSDEGMPSFTSTSLADEPQSSASKPSVSKLSPSSISDLSEEDQDDLEIPAFIRKKMGI